MVCPSSCWEIQWTSTTQSCYLHRWYVRSSDRAANVGNFQGQRRDGKRDWNRIRFPGVREHRKPTYFRVMDVRVHVTDAAIVLRRASRDKKMWMKITLLPSGARSPQKSIHRRVFSRNVLMGNRTVQRLRSKNKGHASFGGKRQKITKIK